MSGKGRLLSKVCWKWLRDELGYLTKNKDEAILFDSYDDAVKFLEQQKGRIDNYDWDPDLPNLNELAAKVTALYPQYKDTAYGDRNPTLAEWRAIYDPYWDAVYKLRDAIAAAVANGETVHITTATGQHTIRTIAAIVNDGMLYYSELRNAPYCYGGVALSTIKTIEVSKDEDGDNVDH